MGWDGMDLAWVLLETVFFSMRMIYAVLSRTNTMEWKGRCRSRFHCYFCRSVGCLRKKGHKSAALVLLDGKVGEFNTILGTESQFIAAHATLVGNLACKKETAKN